MIIDITCRNCGHPWETDTITDPDPYLCHNCGLDNLTRKYEPEKLEAWKRSQMKEEKIPGGLAKGMTLADIAKHHKLPLKSLQSKLEQGIKTEMEHTTDKSIAREIAMDHIYEDPNYYSKLKKIETEGTCGYTMGAETGKELGTPGGLEEGDKKGIDAYSLELQKGLEEAILNYLINEKDPKTGTGKKPKGSGRRLYTDEDPSDTVKVKFSTKQDIIDTLSKASFKSKSHARQSQIINLIHQRVRAAYERAKDPEVKRRLKTALDYAEQRKEASKEKTQRLKKLKEDLITEKCWKGYTQKGMKTMFGKKYPNCVKKVKEVEGGIDTSWTSTDNETITLQDILELTKDIKVQNFPTKELASIVLNWDNNPEEIEKISQVEVSSQYPILIMVDEQGKIQWILDGNHRAQKALSAKAETIPAKLIKPSNLNSKARKILLGMIDENLTEKKGSALPYGSGYKKLIPEITKFMLDKGMNIKPLPVVKFIENDEKNAEDVLGRTAFYNPEEKSITLYTLGRHPKDILRSFCHEMIHHMQNVENRLPKFYTTNTQEDSALNDIEEEAHRLGSMTMREFEDTVKK
jgi:hypothetical protein